MTNFPFENYNTQQVTKIGTAGGWVKGSTGYSFKHTEKKVTKIIANLKQIKHLLIIYLKVNISFMIKYF